MKKLKTVKDPELGIDIVNLGLIYDVTVKRGVVNIIMTFTTPFCPYGSVLERSVRDACKEVEGVKDVNLEITFDPPWTTSRLTEEARFILGYD